MSQQKVICAKCRHTDENPHPNNECEIPDEETKTKTNPVTGKTIYIPPKGRRSFPMCMDRNKNLDCKHYEERVPWWRFWGKR